MIKKKTAKKKARFVTRKIEAVTSVSIKKDEEEDSIVYDRTPISGLPEHPAQISVGGGLTIPLAPYSSARIDISVSIPCGTSNRDIEKAIDRATSIVERRLAIAQEEVWNS